MACRVIADLTFKEGWCEKIRAMLEDEKMVLILLQILKDVLTLICLLIWIIQTE